MFWLFKFCYSDFQLNIVEFRANPNRHKERKERIRKNAMFYYKWPAPGAENSYTQVASGFDSASLWLRKWSDSSNLSQTEAIQI